MSLRLKFVRWVLTIVVTVALGACGHEPSPVATADSNPAVTTTTAAAASTSSAIAHDERLDAPGCRRPDVAREAVCSWTGPGDEDGTRGLVYSFRFTEEFHCGAWPDQLITGVPVGSSRNGGRAFMFVRGEWPELRSTFRVLDSLPPTARDTGFRLGNSELWVPGEVDDEVYVTRDDGRVEAWPRAEHLSGCA